jgi:undecaprenyl-diphosphatase
MDASRLRRDPWVPVGLAAAVAFAILATLVVRRGGLPFDDPVIALVQGLPVSEGAWELFTFLGGGVLIPVGVALGLWALVTGRLRLVAIVAVVLIGATLFTDVVKDLVARPRPPGVHLVDATGYSFPSGHSLNSAATYGLVAVVAWRSAAPLLARRLAVAVGLIVPFLVGLSRIALGVHYPSDVLGGWLAGIAFVAAGATTIVLVRAMVPAPLHRPRATVSPDVVQLPLPGEARDQEPDAAAAES